jgi:hypothetical protein
MDMQYVHVARTCNMDMQHGEAAWMQFGHATLKCTLEIPLIRYFFLSTL